jgi:hypothetical protein
MGAPRCPRPLRGAVLHPLQEGPTGGRSHPWGLALATSPLLAGLGFVVGHPVVVCFIFQPAASAIGALLAVAAMGCSSMLVGPRRRSPEFLRGVLALVIVISGFTYLSVWLWSRPDPGLC